MSAAEAAHVAALMLAWVALIHLLMALGLRLGELVWSGRQPRLLEPALRLRSLLFGMGVSSSALVLAFSAN